MMTIERRIGDIPLIEWKRRMGIEERRSDRRNEKRRIMKTRKEIRW